MYYGWISGEYEDRNILYSLGISFSHYAHSIKTFQDCEVPEKALNQLDPYWGRLYWGLDKVKDEMAR